MGARKKHAPKRGSLAYSPRKRARTLNPTIKTWPEMDEVGVKPLGFAGYKAGMTHIYYIDEYPYSPYKGQEIFSAVSIVETPPLKVIGLVAYTPNYVDNRFETFSTVYYPDVPDFIKRRISTYNPGDWEKNLEEIKSNIERISFIRLLVSTQPILAGIHKKTPEIFEIQLGGKSSIEEKLKYAEELFGKDLEVDSVFKPGDVIDVIAVTKGKGFQGPVKRWGIKLLSHKSRKARRKPGALGPWKPSATRYTVPLAGQTGFHRRTIYHIKILDIKSPEDFDHPLPFPRYGVLKSKFLILKGSVPGSAKRLIKMRFTIRPVRPELLSPVKITYINV